MNQAQILRTEIKAKVILVGDAGTGKTSLIKRFAHNQFGQQHVTIGIDFALKTVNVGDKCIRMQIWDQAGQSRFRTITTSYYRNSHGMFIVFDLTDKRTFEDAKNWYNEASSYKQDYTTIILIGSKSDLTKQREVSQEQAQQLALNLGITYIETSSKDNINVSEAFTEMGSEIISKYRKEDHQVDISKSKLKSQPNKSASSRACC